MRSSCVLLVVAFLGALQNTAARPDFGMNAPVPGSTQTVDMASFASMLLNLLDDYEVNLGSDYWLVTRMNATLFTIAAGLANKGTLMSNGIALLAGDSSGIVTPPFEDAIGGIGEMLTLLSSGFVEEFEALQYRDKTYITDMLTDCFDYFTETLTSLDGMLTLMQTGAEQAQANAGGDELPVSTKLVRNSISGRLVNSVLSTVLLLPGAVSPLLYSLQSSLANVEQADTYVLTTRSDTTIHLMDAHKEVVRFNGELRQLKTDTVDVITTVGTTYSDLRSQIDEAVPQLQGASTFQDDLEGALAAYQLTASAGSIEEKTLLLEQRVTDYIALAKTFDDDLVEVYDVRICPALTSVAEVLMANGPYAAYCFEKYSRDVVDLAAHNFYDITECYQLELNRNYALHRLIVALVDLVSFNYGELVDNLTVCLDAQPCPSACDGCVKTLGELLETLSRLADEKFDLILQIVPYELDASLQRLESCAAFSKYKLIADAHDLINAVRSCEATGYN